MLKKIKIMMAEDHHSAREAYLSILQDEANFEITGAAANGLELIKLVEKNEPDVVIVDVEMPVMDGFKTIIELKRRFPKVKPVVLTMHEETYYVAQLILCGARAYLPKSCHIEDLVLAINKVQADGFYFNEVLARVVVASSFKDRNFQKNMRHIDLSEIEIKVLKYVCDEKSNSEIAKLMQLSISTIQQHRRNIYQKTHSATLVGLIKFAIKNGITEV
jgi:DNA-binding NarL/FixJ family response regulator